MKPVTHNDGRSCQQHHGGMGNNTARNPDNGPAYPSSNAPGGGGAGGFNDNGVGNGAGTFQQQGYGAGTDAGMGAGATGGMGAMGATGLGTSAAHQPMAPQTDMHGVAVHPGRHGTGGQKLEGKLQVVVSTMIDSQSLNASRARGCAWTAWCASRPWMPEVRTREQVRRP